MEFCWVNLFNLLPLFYKMQGDICRPERLLNRTCGTRYSSGGGEGAKVVGWLGTMTTEVVMKQAELSAPDGSRCGVDG